MTRSPDQFPHRILLCGAGMSPQIVTETIYALTQCATPAFVPTEVHIISTTDGLDRARRLLLSRPDGQLWRLCRDWKLPEIHCDAHCLHPICNAQGEALGDIRTPQDNANAADAICTLIASLTQREDFALHVSIAGGRKTMGYYLGHALSLFGRRQDRLSHVLVASEFENLPGFFYPTPQPDVIYSHAPHKQLDPSQAEVLLAEIPFVRLRDKLPKQLLEAPRFAAAVHAVETAHAAPAMPRLEIRFAQQSIVCNGTQVRLPPQSFAYYTWLAERCWDETAAGGLVCISEFNSPASSLRRGLSEPGQRLFPNPCASGAALWLRWDPDDYGNSNNNWPSQRFHDVNKQLCKTLGTAAAELFLIQSVTVGGNRKGRRLNLLPEHIVLISADVARP